jgi:hypothetical protein
MESDIAAQQARNQADVEYAVRGKGADVQTKEEALKETRATMPGKIEATNVANRGKVEAENVKQMERVLDTLNIGMEEISAAGPAAGQVAAQWIKKSGINPNNALAQSIFNAKTPDEMLARINQARSALEMNLETQRARGTEAAKQGLQGERELANIRAQGQNQIAVEAARTAREEAKAQAKAGEAKTAEADMVKARNTYFKTREAYEKKQATAAQVSAAEENYRQAYDVYRAALAAKSQMGPMLTPEGGIAVQQKNVPMPQQAPGLGAKAPAGKQRWERNPATGQLERVE